MDFYLKKYISFFVEPLGFSLTLAFLAFIFFLFESNRKGKWLLFLSLLSFTIFSNSHIANKLLKPLESKYEKLNVDRVKDVKYLLVLGGDTYARTYEVLRLYQNIDSLKIVTSGSNSLEEIPHAIETKNLLVELGVDENDILAKIEPKDTIEEAIMMKELVGEKEFILVTSASHMPRAMEIFKSYDLNPIAAPTGIKTKKINNSFINFSDLDESKKAIHEYVGLFWLKIKGYIS